METLERKNTDLEYINKMYNYIKNDMPVETFMSKFRCNLNELKGNEGGTINGKGINRKEK